MRLLHYAHVLRSIEGVKYLGGDGCGDNAIACASGPHGRWVVLTSPPETSALVELAVTLSHEARHYGFDLYRRMFVVEHTCRDCAAHGERARDAIYQEDERLRQHLSSALAPQPVQVVFVPARQPAAPTIPVQAQWIPPPAPPPDVLPIAVLSLMLTTATGDGEVGPSFPGAQFRRE